MGISGMSDWLDAQTTVTYSIWIGHVCFFNQKYKYRFHNKKCIMISKMKVNGPHITVSLSKDGLFLLETDMTMDKSYFHYGRKDGEYHEFTESVNTT